MGGREDSKGSVEERRIISFRDTQSNLVPFASPPRMIWGAQTRSFALPPLDQNGFLPEGIHNSSLDEMARQFAATPFRRDLWYKCVTFLSMAAATGRFTNAYFGGGFVTSRPYPLDVDLILETMIPDGAGAFKAMEPFFAQGLETILVNYSVHLRFWCEGFAGSIWDCRDFFQYLAPFEAFSLGLSPETRKGIVRMKLAAESSPGEERPR